MVYIRNSSAAKFRDGTLFPFCAGPDLGDPGRAEFRQRIGRKTQAGWSPAQAVSKDGT